MDTFSDQDAPPSADADEQVPPDDTKKRRLERSATNRMVAGVAGGTAEYFGIDPILVRIGFIVLSLLGGLGLVLYASGWLLMPEHDAPSAGAALLSGSRRRQVIWVIGAAAVAVGLIAIASNGPLWFFNHSGGGGRAGWFVVIALLVLIAAGRTRSNVQGAAQDQPRVQRFSIGRALRRIGIALGGVVTAAVLATIVALVLAGVPFHGGIGSRDLRPTSVSELASTYRAEIGSLTIDLGNVRFPNGTTRLNASVAIGRLLIEVPVGVRVNLTAHAGLGNVSYGGPGEVPFNQSGSTSPNAPQLVLNVQAGIGKVELIRSDGNAAIEAAPAVPAPTSTPAPVAA